MSPANSSTNVVDDACVGILLLDATAFVSQLRNDIDIAVHQRIDQFYYMEKCEELRVLSERIDELRSRIVLIENHRACCHEEVTARLTSDKAWLRNHRKTS